MFTEDELNEVALAARRVIAAGLPLTGEKLAEALSAGNDTPSPSIDLLVHNLLSTFDQDPNPGVSIINIADASVDDLRRATQNLDLVILDWSHISARTVFDEMSGQDNIAIACHRDDEVKECWEVIGASIEAIAVLGQSAPGDVAFESIAFDGDDLSGEVDQFARRLSLTGLTVADPGMTGAELEAHLPVLGARHPSIKFVNAESITAVEEAREAMGMGFAVVACFDSARPDRMNPNFAVVAMTLIG